MLEFALAWWVIGGLGSATLAHGKPTKNNWKKFAKWMLLFSIFPGILLLSLIWKTA